MFIDRSYFANNFRKGSPMEHFYEIISKSNTWFYRRRILKNFSEIHKVQKAPPRQPCFFDGSKFHEQFLKRVPQGTILWNYFKFWPAVSEKKIFPEFLHVLIVQNAPIHQSHAYSRIKLSWTIFEKGHPRKISVKLFQNWSNGFWEDFF